MSESTTVVTVTVPSPLFSGLGLSLKFLDPHAQLRFGYLGLSAAHQFAALPRHSPKELRIHGRNPLVKPTLG